MAMPIRRAFLIRPKRTANPHRAGVGNDRAGGLGRQLTGGSPITNPPADVTPRTQAGLRFNEHVFFTLAEAGETIEAWRHDYNRFRPARQSRRIDATEVAALKGQEHKPPQRGREITERVSF